MISYDTSLISPIVENQFPSFYKTEGPLFITFVKAYYEWLESNTQELFLENDENFEVGDTIIQGGASGTIIAKYEDRYLVSIDTDRDIFECSISCGNREKITSSSGGETIVLETRHFNPIFFAQNLSKIRDIDFTIDAFILSFKNKYLPDIQFNTASNKELFIKNALDFYRAKGTERAIDLFFKLIYGMDASVYTPSDDLFRASDNEWVDTDYLEVQPSESNIQFIGQAIRGSNSNATAYVDRLVRLRKGSRFVDIMFITSRDGDFQFEEQIFTDSFDPKLTTKLIGSLTSLSIITSDAGFNVGDTLYALNGLGKQAKIQVKDVDTFTGIIEFSLIKGGWGFTEDSVVCSSKNVLELESVSFTNNSVYEVNDLLKFQETIEQPLLTLETESSTPTILSTVQVLDGANVEFEGIVVQSDSDNNQAVISYNSDVYSNTDIVNTEIYEVEANTIHTLNAAATSDSSATGIVVGVSSTSTLQYSLANGDLITTETRVANNASIYQNEVINGIEREVSNGYVSIEYLNTVSGQYFINIESDIGEFRTDRNFIDRETGISYSIVERANTMVGIANTVNTFYGDGFIKSNETGTTGIVKNAFGYETPASFVISQYDNALVLEDYYSNVVINEANLSITIDTASYGFGSNTSLGYDDIITEITPFANLTIQSIDTLVTTSIGKAYPTSPFFFLYEPKSVSLERYDYEIRYVESDRSFAVGEKIIGNTSNAIGEITFHDPNEKKLLVTRLSLDVNNFVEDDFDVGEEITGQDTNITASIGFVNELRRKRRVGMNAEIGSRVFSGSNIATNVSVINSGYGYVDGETITFAKEDDTDLRITGIISLETQGINEGYFASKNSFLSDNKYLHDSDYYQEYSYLIRTALPFETYRDVLTRVLHVAGTKPFGSYFSTDTSRANFTISDDSSLTIS